MSPRRRLAGEVLATGVVRDLTAGSGLGFLRPPWGLAFDQLFTVTSAAAG